MWQRRCGSGSAAAAAIAAVLAAAACGERRREPAPPPVAEPPVCPLAAAGPFRGEATRYDADGTGSCSFEAAADRRVAAISAADYAKAAWCGACVEVSGPKGRAVVRIVDRCPACKTGDLDLSREAFAAIAAPAAGRVAIEWSSVPCDVTGPIEYRLKDGSNAFWTAIQLRNHRYAIASVDARDPAGWRPLSRTAYNYFVATGGLGRAPLALRIADVRGQVIEDEGVPAVPAVPTVAAGSAGSGSAGSADPAASQDAAAQLPRCRGD